jgi:hypothetical protein
MTVITDVWDMGTEVLLAGARLVRLKIVASVSGRAGVLDMDSGCLRSQLMDNDSKTSGALRTRRVAMFDAG